MPVGDKGGGSTVIASFGASGNDAASGFTSITPRRTRIQRLSAQRMMNEQRPAARPYQPLNGHSPAMRAQLVATLSVSVSIGLATAVELRPAFPEAQNRFVVQHKI